ncbi:MAG: trypsin-like peptidase domain-containing protein [Bifidobacteriaceae bacterium]|jgi:putative serine protease PepD|nr:trypsin-like peptidase domain-containing protein [Bifidobacteriaceae bacterium]
MGPAAQVQPGTPPSGPPQIPPTQFVAAPPPDRPSRKAKERKHRVGLMVGSAALIAALVASVSTAALVTRGFSRPAAQVATSGDKVYNDLSSGKAAVSVPIDGSAAAAPDWAKVAAAVQPSVVAIQVSARYLGAEGSGVIINSKDGYVVTNNHVVTGADQIQVVLADGRIYEAKVLGTDATTDLAVIQIENRPDDLQEAVLGESSDVTVGEPVMAVGNPLGYDNTVTTGIISALNRPVTTTLTGATADTAVTNVIQVDAAINPGNSGGPLFNGVGEVIGINSAIATTSSINQESAGSIGVAFAIPIDLVEVIAPQLIEKGSAEHAYLGVTLVAKTVTYDGVTRQGAAIDRVWPGTAAEEAGLRAGDVIVAVDGHATTEVASLTAWVRSYSVGQEVSLLVVRDGKALELPVTLGAQDASQLPGEELLPQPDPTYPQGDGGYFFDDPFGLFD